MRKAWSNCCVRFPWMCSKTPTFSSADTFSKKTTFSAILNTIIINVQFACRNNSQRLKNYIYKEEPISLILFPILRIKKIRRFKASKKTKISYKIFSTKMSSNSEKKRKKRASTPISKIILIKFHLATTTNKLKETIT